MTIEQIKALAKEKLNLNITDEQAGEWLAEHKNRTLTDEELVNVSGGTVCSDLRSHTGIALEKTKDESEEYSGIQYEMFRYNDYMNKLPIDELLKKLIAENDK